MSRFRETIVTTKTLALSHPTFIDCSSPFNRFDQVERTPLYTTRTVQHRVQRVGAEPHVQKLCNGVSALERHNDRLNSGKAHAGDQKYKRTAEIKGEKEKNREEPKVERNVVDRTYKRTAVIKCEKSNNKKDELYKCTAEMKKLTVTVEKKYKWTAEIKKLTVEKKNYTCTAEIKKIKVEKSCKCTTEIKKKSKGNK